MHKRLNGIPAVARETQGPEDTADKLEEERLLAQELIDTGTVPYYLSTAVYTLTNQVGFFWGSDFLEGNKL